MESNTNPYDILMVQLLQSGNIAQQNFISTQKIIDYDHLEYKRRLSVDEAIALRQVMGGSDNSE